MFLYTVDGNVDGDEDEVETPKSHDWHTTANDTLMTHYKEEQFNVRFKFKQQARFMPGVIMVETKNGEIEGRRLPLYMHSGKKIIGMGKYEEGIRRAKEKAKKSESKRT